MKRWLLPLLVSLAILQPPILAQNNPDPTNSPASPQTEAAPASFQPVLIPLQRTEQIQLQVVNCSGVIDCTLARLLLPATTQSQQRELYFDNPSTTAVTILNTVVIVEGNLTNYQLPSRTIAIASDPNSFPPNQISRLILTYDRSSMPPDQYEGAAYLTVSNQRNRITLPITLSVRSGPIAPLLVLFLGIVLGRLLKYMETRGEAQIKALRGLNRLRLDLRSAHLHDQNILAPMLDRIRKFIDREQLEEATTALSVVRNRLDTLNEIREIEAELDLLENEKTEAIALLQQARRYLAQEEDAKSKETLEKVSQLLDSAPRGVAGSEVAATIRGAESNLQKNIQQPTIVLTQSSRYDRFQDVLIGLSGVSDRVRTEATFWIVRPILSLVLLVGLAIAGLNALYVENGTTFGARPLPDYLGLILWGLSADVASRSLSNLRGTN